jgi:Tfp pilus assembly protein PilV
MSKVDSVTDKKERGFTLLEVAVASVISMSGLVFLATLFTLAMSQNKHVKQSTSSVSFAQEKIESLCAVPGMLGSLDPRLAVGGDLQNQTTNYFEQIYVDDSGTVTTPAPAGAIPTYNRYWKIEADPTLANAIIISVRVAAVRASRGTVKEETTLTTIRTS